MLRRAGHLLRVLALGTLAVPVYALKFNITDVQQCEPVVIAFSGSTIQTLPTFLTVIPLNSTAIVIPLQPNPDLISTGISLSFLPLDANSNFLASLDDGECDALIQISDLIRVLPSPTQNSSCLSKHDVPQDRHFNLTTDNGVSQCEDFSISYDTNAVFKAPSIRLFNPRGVSFFLNNTSDDPESGIATYTMNFTRGSEVALLMDNGAGIRETTSLLTVGGDSSSSKSCIIGQDSDNSTKKSINATSVGDDKPVATKAIIIGSIAGGSAVLLIALGMIIFVLRDRRRRRKPQPVQFDPSAMEKAVDNKKESPGNMDVTPRPLKLSATGTGAVSNPIYTTKSFMSTGIGSSKPRGSMASWAQVIPDDQRYPSSTISRSSTAPSPSARLAQLDNSDIVVIPPDSGSPAPFNRPSLETLDIEGMLNMASVQSAGSIAGSRKNSDVAPFGPVLRRSSLTVPTSTYARKPTDRRHLRDPSDVPTGPDSMLFSGYSVNPFDNQDAAFQEPLRTGDSLRSPGGAGLPRSPRVNPIEDRVKVSSGMSEDWYGIAR